MNSAERSPWATTLLLGVWLLVVGWQVEEHKSVVETAKADLGSRSSEIANTVSAVIRAQSFRGIAVQDRLEPVLKLLVSSRTNALLKSSELLSVTLLNASSDPVISIPNTNYLANTNYFSRDWLASSEYWSSNYVAFVLPVEGATILPSPARDSTNGNPRGPWDFQRGGLRPDGGFPPGGNGFSPTNFPPPTNGEMGPPPNQGFRPPDGGERPPRDFSRPGWLRWMPEADFKTLIATHELHGLVLQMSTDKFRATCTHDLWLRFVIGFFAGISVLGAGMAWRNIGKTAELQIRLVRASELNSHLKELNLAAAGLAHETRNPLNIIRGQALMISRLPETAADVREKSKTIVDETDKVTAQLTEFINYSRPREVRRTRVPLAAAANEIVRTLGHDIGEKKLRVEVTGDPLAIEADEQLLRQVLFNLLLNAIQAAGENGSIQVAVRRAGATDAALEVRDDGPGVPPEHRAEIFKPYFTTHQKGTGLGLAVVQQIVLAHGWEINCLGNEPHGAVFRVTHLKIAA